MHTFLHVGCGPKRKDQTTKGFNTAEWQELRFDIDAAVNPDITGTMTDMSAVPSASVDAIYSSHNIEHLYPSEIPIALKEFKRVLKPEGFAVITCPDLQAAAEMIAANRMMEAAYSSPGGVVTPFDIVYGHRGLTGPDSPYMSHRCGFTKKVLAGVLTEAGFSSIAITRRPRGFDLWVLATVKPIDEVSIKKMAVMHFPE